MNQIMNRLYLRSDPNRAESSNFDRAEQTGIACCDVRQQNKHCCRPINSIRFMVRILLKFSSLEEFIEHFYELYYIIINKFNRIFYIHCGNVYRVQGFVTCFLASSPWLMGTTTAIIQPRQVLHST